MANQCIRYHDRIPRVSYSGLGPPRLPSLEWASPNNPLNLTGAAFRFRVARSRCSGPGKLAQSFGGGGERPMDLSDLEQLHVAVEWLLRQESFSRAVEHLRVE